MGFFDTLFGAQNTNMAKETNPQRLQLITATLLIEVSKADFLQDKSELSRINHLLKDHFALNSKQLELLMEQAQQHSDRIISLQQMTRELNETLSQHDKIKVIELMWQVVYADGEKDRYEEYLMRQVSDLLYVSHEHFIKARHKAELI